MSARAPAPWRSACTSPASCRGSRPARRAASSKSRRIVAKNSFIASRTPLVNGLSSMLRRVRPALARSASRPMTSKSCVRLLREHGAQRGVALQPALEELLLLAHALHHVLDDVLVLAAQRAQLGELLGDARSAARRAARARPRRARALRPASPRRRCRASPGMSLRDSASSSTGRRLFASSASSPLTLASSAFCADTANTCAAGSPSSCADDCAPGGRFRRRPRPRT